MFEAIQGLTNGDFEARVLEGEHTVVVVFWAPWCGPSRTFLENVSGLIGETSIEFLKVNVDAESELADLYEVQNIPHTNVFANASVVKSFVGYQTRRGLSMKLAPWL